MRACTMYLNLQNVVVLSSTAASVDRVWNVAGLFARVKHVAHRRIHDIIWNMRTFSCCQMRRREACGTDIVFCNVLHVVHVRRYYDADL